MRSGECETEVSRKTPLWVDQLFFFSSRNFKKATSETLPSTHNETRFVTNTPRAGTERKRPR